MATRSRLAPPRSLVERRWPFRVILGDRSEFDATLPADLSHDKRLGQWGELLLRRQAACVSGGGECGSIAPQNGYCFSQREQAEAFHLEFGGRLIDHSRPIKRDKLGWSHDDYLAMRHDREKRGE